MKKNLLLCAVFALAGTAWAAAPMPVVASFSILADLTREVGGERVDVVPLVGADQDAHVYQPRPADVKKLGAAKVFVVNGLGYEGWVSRLAKTSGFKGVNIVATQGVKPLQAGHDDHGHDHGGVDPHAWHDPKRVVQYVKNIEAGLAKADPAGRDYYRTRAAAYTQKVEAADAWAAKAFAAVPAAQRKVLTSHDAFAYLGDRYQIRFLSPRGVSTEAEASAKTVATLIRQVRQDKVKAVFVENMSDPRLIEQLSREAGVKVGGRLYSDALAGSAPANSYLGLFRTNVGAIVSALR
ncbi:metal ABC transporter solute-binding protein, Zn/Mn family [Crenobacter intestini]|uniref:Metal ABC transporter substrate-binding protein n=1 Tax=Crenobacter intestini TaxID=2563443 RepID=A0A4T0V5D4_9NEIS|nr:zinc ABC transporter substrate-binding protein [Crenobacter intestini]TIC86960.1 metal ABC transporter substrate-binding protein [Crenobacter intestini]